MREDNNELKRDNNELKREINVIKEIMKDDIDNYYNIKQIEKEEAKKAAQKAAYIAVQALRELKLKMYMFIF